MEHIFNPSPSIATIQSFALLALWSPFDPSCPSSSETRDSRLIAAAAINMCSTLRCDQAATDEEVLQERGKLGVELTPQDVASLITADQKKLLVCSPIIYRLLHSSPKSTCFFPVDVRPQHRVHVSYFFIIHLL